MSDRILLCAAAMVALLAGDPAAAQSWKPTKAVELIVPSAAGGGLDTTARAVQRILEQGKLVETPVTVTNKPGGAGTVGIAYMNTHRGDGHYLNVQSPPMITNGITGSSPLGLADVTPVAVLLGEEIFFSVAAASPIRSGRDLVERLKADPTQISIAMSSSPGGHSHIAAALVMKAIGGDPKKLKMVAFGSGAEAATALMGGHVTVAVTPASSVIGHDQAGKIRVIAAPAAKRTTGALAHVPTWREQGVDVVFSNWRAIVGPKGMGAAQLAYWDAVLARTVAHPDWQSYLDKNLWAANYMDSKAAAAFFAGEQDRLRAILAELGMAK